MAPFTLPLANSLIDLTSTKLMWYIYTNTNEDTCIYTGQLANTNFNMGGLQSGNYMIKIIDNKKVYYT